MLADQAPLIFHFCYHRTVRFPSTASIGPGGNPVDPAIFEMVCFTRDLDTWWQARSNQDEEYWNSVGLRPLGMHFGSITGAFRIWPALFGLCRHPHSRGHLGGSMVCGTLVRPCGPSHRGRAAGRGGGPGRARDRGRRR